MPIAPVFPGAGGGGDSTVTPPSPTSESVASGSNFSAKTFGSFTDPDGIIASYQAVTTNTTGSTSWSGSGLGAYTASSSAGDAGTLSLNAKDSDGNVVATAVHTYSRAAASTGGPAWSTIHEIDFTSDITDLTLTKGGGDTNLLEADGSTVKAVVGYADRISTTTSSAVITSSAGKFLLTSNSGGSSTRSSYVYVKLTESGTGVDWDDGSKVFAIDLVITGHDMLSNGDVVFFAIGTNSAGIGANSNFGIRSDRDSATDYNQAGRRYFNATATNGSQQNSDTSVPGSLAVRIIVTRGVIVDAYWQEGTSRLVGFPTAGSGVFRSLLGNPGIGMEASPETVFGSTFYAFMDILTTSSNNGTAGLNSLRIQEYSPSTTLKPLLDWSDASEGFGSGAGSYTIGGLSVTLDFNGTSGPSSLSLSSGVLTFTGNVSSNQGYLVIDLGEDLNDGAFVVYASFDGVSHNGSSASAVVKIADNTTVGNAGNQFQFLLGFGGGSAGNTRAMERECDSSSPSFSNINNRTSLTNITTTPTLFSVQWSGISALPAVSQGSATLPTDGGLLGTIGPDAYNHGANGNAPQNRRYLHLYLIENCTVRIAAYRLELE
mgnify:FL=1